MRKIRSKSRLRKLGQIVFKGELPYTISTIFNAHMIKISYPDGKIFSFSCDKTLTNQFFLEAVKF